MLQNCKQLSKVIFPVAEKVAWCAINVLTNVKLLLPPGVGQAGWKLGAEPLRKPMPTVANSAGFSQKLTFP